jgi:hypothetical protein
MVLEKKTHTRQNSFNLEADTPEILILQQLKKLAPSPEVVQKGPQECLCIDYYGIS